MDRADADRMQQVAVMPEFRVCCVFHSDAERSIHCANSEGCKFVLKSFSGEDRCYIRCNIDEDDESSLRLCQALVLVLN